MRTLTLAVLGCCLAAAQTPKPTLWLIGDSTVRNGQGNGSNGQWGWGEPLSDHFDPTKIKVSNRALGGRSSRTFISGGQWAAVLAQIQPGDFVIMQFGHNDSSPVNDDSRARGTLKGTGDETEEIDNLLTKQHEVVHTYGWYLRKFIADARAKGATPSLCSPIPRNNFKEGKVVRNSQDWGKWAADVATSEKVAFVDLNSIIADRYDQLGAEKVAALFQGDHTHTSREGAELNAKCVIEGLKKIDGNPFGPYYRIRDSPQ
jgi:lysophospholipase L1-like esterase